jgi:pseudouridine-5'-phosphate glycosidase
MVGANPIPAEHAMERDTIDQAIAQALQEAAALKENMRVHPKMGTEKE